MNDKQQIRRQLIARYEKLWPDASLSGRPPVFEGRGRAAERLRRQPVYRQAKVIAVMPDPVLLQVRINALGDGKTLIAATPGLKQGLVRITPDQAPPPNRGRDLAGGALFKTGRQLRFPKARMGKVDLLVGAALAVDRRGVILGDGRGLLDLTYALLTIFGGGKHGGAPTAVIAAAEQLVDELPADDWDLGANLCVTPDEAFRHQPAQPRPRLANLPPKLASLPVVRWAREREK
jgi:5-formyltetrahydrofolate cyclo-ligase